MEYLPKNIRDQIKQDVINGLTNAQLHHKYKIPRQNLNYYIQKYKKHEGGNNK